MSNRKVYHVTYDTDDQKWKGKLVGAERASVSADTKEEAVERTKEIAKAAPLSQIIIHTKHGIETEHTYGDDPRDIPG